MPGAIVLKNISKTYRIPSMFPWRSAKKTEALKNVTLECPGSKITCLLGPNGAGKTTIIKILAGLILPDAGVIEMFGRPLTGRTSRKKINTGLVSPNERSFYWRLTGRQNLDFFGSLHGLRDAERRGRISEILNELELENEADKPFWLYSAGMRQKLLIARALLAEPDILLLDEPTIHIDPVMQKSIHDIIIKNISEKRKIAILLCTHDLLEAQKLADNIVLLDKGRIIAEGSIELLRKIVNPDIRVRFHFLKLPEKGWEKILNAEILEHSDNCIELRIPNENSIPEAINAAVSGGGKILSCCRNEESLLEIFSRLTGGDAA